MFLAKGVTKQKQVCKVQILVDIIKYAMWPKMKEKVM